MGKFRNTVPSVAINRDLVFQIADPHTVPDYAEIEWTVRNEGEDADSRSDLGHRRSVPRMLLAREHTAYIGRHFMDCVVRVNGQGLRCEAVVVNVSGSQQTMRSPPTPSYGRLRSAMGRRRRR